MFSLDGLIVKTSDRYGFARKVTQEGTKSCRTGDEEEKINPHVLVRTRKRKVLSARGECVEVGEAIKCNRKRNEERRRRRRRPFSAKCNFEKPREMFVIGIVGSLCSPRSREKEREACPLFARERARP